MGLNVYQLVTDRIIAELEKGHIPWRQPWGSVRSGAYNRISKKSYSLLNQMLLRHRGEYATYKQWQELGGNVRKGESAEIVVFWKLFRNAEMNSNGNVTEKKIPMLRYYSVFHISQVDGIEPLPQEYDLQPLDPIDSAEEIFTEYINREGIRFVQELHNEAFYSPSRDMIHLPLREQFKDQSKYYSTLFHETVHSTGHPSRLSRLDPGLQTAHFGSENYSKEELVAELGAANILNYLGIETEESFTNSTAYIQNWLQVLRSDSRFIVSAASKAEKAVKYILGGREASENAYD